MKMKKVMLISTSVISIIALLLKLLSPIITQSFITTNDFPLIIFSSTTLTLSWLQQPPYLYIIINCIILSILASSKLHSDTAVDTAVKRDFHFVVAPETPEVEVEVEVVKEIVFGYAPVKKQEVVVVEEVAEKVEEKAVVEVERMPYTARFGHRKGVKASPEGKTVLKKVSRPKRQETLESTWRTLTEGRSMPLTRHLRKSDTFIGPQQEASSPVHVMKKSDTFSYGDGGVETPSPGSSGGKLRREPSLSQDDLNRRVEAFIKKFNEEMRLQQLQSVRQY